jgi:hypothetical protein
MLNKHKINVDDFHSTVEGSYLELETDLSRLDGMFSSDELRRIATAMDELKEIKGNCKSDC